MHLISVNKNVYKSGRIKGEDKVMTKDAFFTEVIQCIDEIEKNCSGNMPVFDDKNFRALFFDYYKQKKNIAVITRTFQKIMQVIQREETRRIKNYRRK